MHPVFTKMRATYDAQYFETFVRFKEVTKTKLRKFSTFCTKYYTKHAEKINREKMKISANFAKHSSAFDVLGAVYIYQKMSEKKISLGQMRRVKKVQELNHMVWS